MRWAPSAWIHQDEDFLLFYLDIPKVSQAAVDRDGIGRWPLKQREGPTERPKGKTTLTWVGRGINLHISIQFWWSWPYCVFYSPRTPFIPCACHCWKSPCLFPKDRTTCDSLFFPAAHYRWPNLTLTVRLRAPHSSTVGAQDTWICCSNPAPAGNLLRRVPASPPPTLFWRKG